MTTNGKQKGSRAEREVCKLLAAWWLPFEPKVDGQDITFTRTPGSGGWSHGKGRQSFGTAADIVTNSKLFPFAVEVKHRQNWSLTTLAAGKKSPVWGWWAQACAQGKEMGKIPMLFFRKNHMPWQVMLPSAAWQVADKADFYFTKAAVKQLSLPEHPVVYNVDDFFSTWPAAKVVKNSSQVDLSNGK